MFRLWGVLLSQLTKTLYPAFTQSNFEFESHVKPKFTFNGRENTPLSNFQNYVNSARSSEMDFDEQDNIRRGKTYWSNAFFDGFRLPAQGLPKPYCKKWISWGCNNTKQHPYGKHYAEHEQKTCKTAHCPLCFESWINRQANRSARRFAKFAKGKKYNFRHIILSPPPEKAITMSYNELKKWLTFALKVANIKTCAIVFHPFRFHDNQKLLHYVSPHFHLLVYGNVTNTTEFYNKTQWIIKNEGDMKTDVDVFNCVRYLLSHAGVRRGTHVIRYLGDISYRKLKVEKEPQKHFCPYCKLPLTIFFIKYSPKSLKPPIDLVGLWDPDNFFPYYPNEDSRKEKGVPFYKLRKGTKDDTDYCENLIYSFEEILSVNTNLPKIAHRKYELSQVKFVSSLNCQKLEDFLTTKITN